MPSIHQNFWNFGNKNTKVAILACVLYTVWVGIRGPTGSVAGHRPLEHGFKPPTRLCQKGISSFTSPHYLWRLLRPFSLQSSEK